MILNSFVQFWNQDLGTDPDNKGYARLILNATIIDFFGKTKYSCYSEQNVLICSVDQCSRGRSVRQAQKTSGQQDTKSLDTGK